MSLTRQPKKGERVIFPDGQPQPQIGTVVRIDGNLCWCSWEGRPEIEPFLWRFADGTLNRCAEIQEVGAGVIPS